MKKFIVSLLLLTSCTSCHHGHSGHNSHSHAHSSHCKAETETPGIGYLKSLEAVFLARDLTDEEIDNADNGPGSGYHDGKGAAENADQYAVEKVYQDEGGTIVIIEDDGEIHVVKA